MYFEKNNHSMAIGQPALTSTHSNKLEDSAEAKLYCRHALANSKDYGENARVLLNGDTSTVSVPS